MIVSLGAGAIPPVQVVLSGAELVSGQEWALEATYTDGLGAEVTYTPRGGYGVGAGAQVVVIDLAAPIQREVSYRLIRNGTQVSTGSVTRTSNYRDAFVSLSGAMVVPFVRMPGHSWTPEPRMHSTVVPGNPFSPTRMAPTAGLGSTSINVMVEAAHAALWRELVMLNAPVYVLHDIETDDDIPGVELVTIKAAGGARENSRAPRMWSLTLTPQPDPEPALLVGLSTWDEFDDHFAGKTWTDFNAMFVGQTWDAFDLVDWSEAG